MLAAAPCSYRSRQRIPFIVSFAFPIVVLTACVVARVSHALIPGFTLALGFLLGGLVSPPDAILATTSMRQVKVPRVLTSVTEAEILFSDASSRRRRGTWPNNLG